MSERRSLGLRRFRVPLFVMTAVLVALWVTRGIVGPAEPRRIAYSELQARIESGGVSEVEVQADDVVAVLEADGGAPPQRVVAERIPNMDERALLESLERQHVVVRGDAKRPSLWGPILWGVLPLLVLPLLFWVMGSAVGAGERSRPMTFGKSRAKLYDRRAEQAVSFADVAGVDEAKAELAEVVRFLRQPELYRNVGAHVPKGVLLVGRPGTGKTLLARAVAGESGVPFFSMSGSEFVEMFVGVGASRVRDLFEQAKVRAPCIIFIDELDAIGKARSGAAGFAANEEREQTLNQLLVEMDGFEPGSGLVLLAATNRPEILDRALLRAGRFDRQVVVDPPDVRGREAILRVHVRKVPLAPDADLGVVARRTPGMVGADLANVVNEAALASVRRGGATVTFHDFEEAIDRLQLGLKKEGRILSDDEKHRVAYHEAGHALVALSTPHADPVHRVTIIPRTIGALGATLQLPTEEHFLLTREELEERAAVLLGGRAAEELACHGGSTGAEDDLDRATLLARQLVTRFGLSEALGPVRWERGASLRYLDGEGIAEREYAEETARAIDHEVRRIVEAARARARALLQERRETLDAIASRLVAEETLDGAQLAEMVRPLSGSRTPVAQTSPAPRKGAAS